MHKELAATMKVLLDTSEMCSQPLSYNIIIDQAVEMTRHVARSQGHPYPDLLAEIIVRAALSIALQIPSSELPRAIDVAPITAEEDYWTECDTGTCTFCSMLTRGKLNISRLH